MKAAIATFHGDLLSFVDAAEAIEWRQKRGDEENKRRSARRRLAVRAPAIDCPERDAFRAEVTSGAGHAGYHHVMENPWVSLPSSSPFVLDCDRDCLNRCDPSNLLLDQLPVPYSGARNAAVVLLMLNPGGGQRAASADYIDQCRKRLLFASRVPFMSLDDAFVGMHGSEYWRKRLRLLVERVGLEKLRRQLLCLQYFPYQSKTYKPLAETLPSQRFTFEICREAIRDGRMIVFMRSRRLWESAVPELKAVAAIELNNPRSPYLTPTNIPGDGFERIVNVIAKSP